MPMFSAVVPVYNVEKYLRGCIDSILEQTFSDFELILVDDGSKDGSGKICDEYAAKDDRVIVIHKQNGGQSTARNVGVKQAKGEYIIFVDSDDYIVDNNFFQNIFQRVQGKKPDIVAFKYCEYFENNKTIRHSNYDYSQIDDEKSLNEKSKYLIKQDAFFCSAWSKTVKRSLLIEENIIFDENSRCEDMDWFFSVIEKSQTMLLCDKEYVAYRRRDDSVTSTVGVKNLNDYLCFFEKWGQKLSEMTDKKRAEVMCFAAGKLYMNLLLAYLACKDKEKKQIKKELKGYSYFLDYNLNPRVNKLRIFKKFFGFYGLLLALKVLLILK